MKFSFAATAVFALSLLGTEAANPKIVILGTTGAHIPVTSTTVYHRDGTKHSLGGDFLDGCKSKGYKGHQWFKQICIDSKNKRAHVTYADGYKRCFKRTKYKNEDCGGDEGCWKGVCQRCYESVYTQANC